MKRQAAIVFCAVATLFATERVRAQVLADQVPGDAVVYFGWAGSDAVKAQYAGTHFEAIMKESRAEELPTTYLDQIESQFANQPPEALEAFKIFRSLAVPLWKHPAAFYLGKPDLTDKRMPHVTLAILSQAGDQADAIAQDLAKKLPRSRAGEPNLAVSAKGGLVTFLVSSERAPALDLSKGALAAAPTFKSALGQVRSNAVVTTFVDYQALISTVESALAVHEPNGAQKAKAFLDASGLRGMKHLVTTGGFEGKNWAVDVFLATDSQRSGLLKAMPATPMNADLLKVVPKDATMVRTFHFDPAVLASEMRNTLGKTDEGAVRQYNQVFGFLQQALGANVEKSILEPLGNDWVAYGAPQVGGGGVLGLVLVNKLDDPAAMQKGLETVSPNLTNWANQMVAQAGVPVPVNIHGAKTKIGDAEVNYLATPLVAPTWAIADGNLYIGFYPQTVGAAIRQARAGKGSILESEKYVNALKLLNQDKPEAVGFYDLPTSARYGGMYTTLLAITRYVGMADLFGMTLPEPLMPPMDVVLDHLEPAADITWSDASGIHSRAVMSFPGAVLLNEQTAMMSMGAGGAAMMASVALPAMTQARENARRVQSMSNLRQIGVGLQMYAQENDGKMPDTLGPLVVTYEMGPEVFDNVRNGKLAVPPEVRNDPEALSQFVTENSDYVYLGAGKAVQDMAQDVIAYEKPDGLSDGVNFLFGDGHVEFMPMDVAMERIEELKQKAGV